MIALKQVIHYTDTNSVEATWVDGNGNVVRCHSYDDRQMDMLRADLGDDAPAYEELMALVEANQKPLPPPPPPTIDDFTNAVQKRLDDFARTRNYDGILSLCTYATSSVPRFALEGQRGVDLRDQTWASCYQIMAEVQNGERPMPTVDELLDMLPAVAWAETNLQWVKQ